MSGIMEILVGPSRRWREDALRNLPFMGQMIHRPVVAQIRENVQRVLARSPFFHDVVERPLPSDSGLDLSLEALLSPIYRPREVSTATGEIVIDRSW